MNISVGIVGLPNVGKSTLFNALLKKQQALAANYPFATIEPNVGIVPVPDERLNKLAEITMEEEKMSSLPPLKPATVEFVDIAGLVKGASEGEGLGNKFLSHIREVRVIAHVVRAFEDSNVIREGSTDTASDYDTIKTELILADLQSIEKALENRKMEPFRKDVLTKLSMGFNEGRRAIDILVTPEEQEAVRDLFLLTNKPEIIVLNVSEDMLASSESVISEYSQKLGIDASKLTVICAQVEAELATLDETEQKEYLESLGVEKSGLENLIQKAYQELGLISFLTAGEKEVRAWTMRRGDNAMQASGEIHTDFMKKFIKAEIVGYADFVENRGWKGSREKGRARLEGKEYVMRDGDIVEFKIGA